MMQPGIDTLAFMPGHWELLLIGLFGLLIFGKRLPEVGKSLGKSIVEFKKGLKGIGDDIDQAADEQSQKDMLPPPESEASDTHERPDAEAKPAASNSEAS
jgi:sec-independent protein translocase protein TatA